MSQVIWLNGCRTNEQRLLGIVEKQQNLLTDGGCPMSAPFLGRRGGAIRLVSAVSVGRLMAQIRKARQIGLLDAERVVSAGITLVFQPLALQGAQGRSAPVEQRAQFCVQVRQQRRSADRTLGRAQVRRNAPGRTPPGYLAQKRQLIAVCRFDAQYIRAAKISSGQLSGLVASRPRIAIFYATVKRIHLSIQIAQKRIATNRSLGLVQIGSRAPGLCGRRNRKQG